MMTNSSNETGKKGNLVFISYSKSDRPHKPILIAVSIIVLLTAAVFLIIQLVKNRETTTEDTPPEDVKAIETKASKENIKIEIKQNQKGFWEVDYKEYKITMIYIPPGKFMMGSDDGEAYEKPLHEVDLDGYFIGKTEVTNARYVEFLNNSKIDHKSGCQGKPCIEREIGAR